MQLFALFYSKAIEIQKSVGASLVLGWQHLVSTGCPPRGTVGSKYSCSSSLTGEAKDRLAAQREAQAKMCTVSQHTEQTPESWRM